MLRFLHISDTHISADPEYHPPWIPAAVRHPQVGAAALLRRVSQLPFEIDFILHTGDVCADPIAADYHCARDLLRQFDAPMFLLPGNHDSAELMLEILHDGERLQVLGDARICIKGYTLVTLNSNGEGDVHAPEIGEERIQTLSANLAAAAGPIIVALHHPLLAVGVPVLDEGMRVQNGERIHNLLASRAEQIAGVFHGHIHQLTNTTRDGVTYICCPSTWSNLAAHPGLLENTPDLDTPAGFSLVMIDDGVTFVRRYSLPLPD